MLWSSLAGTESAAELLVKGAHAARRRRQLTLRAMLGVDLTGGVETALTIASEVGPDCPASRARRTSAPG